MATKSKKQIKPSEFVHLHNHSHYSLLDGLQKVPEMLERVQKLGMDAVALTDHGTLSGAIEFYKEAKERDIKAIIGCEAYIAPRRHTDKEGKPDANPYHLTVLAMNNQGYQNLMKLCSLASLEGFYYKPRIDHELLEKYNEGLIILSGCLGGEVGSALEQGDYNKAKQIAQWYQGVFGDRYYLEVQDHGHEWEVQAQANEQILKLGEELGIAVVVTADAHYCTPEDQNAHEVLLCVQTASQLEDSSRMSLKDMHLFVSDPVDIAARWQSHPEVLTNTRQVADRCQVTIEFGQILIPKFQTPDGSADKDYLEKLAYAGVGERYGGKNKQTASQLSREEVLKLVDQTVADRLQFELEAIHTMALDSYFLIVADFINWAKTNGIMVGPGRGSAAGSIVSYALGITDLEPLQYDLLFERFINPERISMPDIDIDFQDDRRDEVIRYVAQKYGEDQVANIVTFGTMAARNAIRDTARVMGLPYADADRMAKMVPPPVQGRHTPLSKHIQEVAELGREYRDSPQSKQVLDLAMRLEGTIRSHGVHAAGVVIAPDEITKFTPLEMAQKGVVATQYSMGPIEDLGLLKMDFLGLSNLTTIKNALRIIRKVYDQEISMGQLPLDDKKTFELLASGNTTGVFQLESAGMKRYLKQLKPSVFEDIIAMVALYRPGPMQWIDDFIARKHGRKEISFMHPAMKEALTSTYGVIVYQEQVMQISKDLCGFSGGQADTLRKAIGKKNPVLLAKMKEEFIEGGVKHGGADRGMMERFWKQLEEFAAYCFNKSHAACYGLIAYQTAYLKAHYPAAFMAALLTSDFEDTDRIAIEINECRQLGIEVLPPDVNESFVEFAVMPKTGAIRFGMAAVKNVGVGAVEKILEEREHGKFKSVEDFAKRVSNQYANKKVWESLIKAGAFDSLGDRAQLLYNLDNILAYAAKLQKEGAEGQTDLFGGQLDSLTTLQLYMEEAVEASSEREQLQWERALLGVYLSKHPLEDYRAYLEDQTTAISEIKPSLEGRQVTVAGFINEVRKITTRNGSNMAFVKLEDLSGELELIVFPKLFEAEQSLWEADKVLEVKGKVSTKDREGHILSELKIMADEAKELDDGEVRNYKPSAVPKPKAEPAAKPAASSGNIKIRIPTSNDMKKLAAMRELLSKYEGESEVLVVIGEKADTTIKLPFRVKLNAELTEQLNNLFSREAVEIS